MRNFGITRDLLPSQIAQRASVQKFKDVRADLGGQASARTLTRDTQRDFFTTERVNPDDYELGGYAIFVLVVGGSCAVVLGLVMAYLVFV